MLVFPRKTKWKENSMTIKKGWTGLRTRRFFFRSIEFLVPNMYPAQHLYQLGGEVVHEHSMLGVFIGALELFVFVKIRDVWSFLFLKSLFCILLCSCSNRDRTKNRKGKGKKKELIGWCDLLSCIMHISSSSRSRHMTNGSSGISSNTAAAAAAKVNTV